MASSIDLSTASGFDYTTSEDVSNGKFTISFFDRTTHDPVGMIVLSTKKARALLATLEVIASHMSDEFEENYVTHGSFNSVTGQGFMEFAPPPETRL